RGGPALARQGACLAGTSRDTAQALDTVPEAAAPAPAAPRPEAPRASTPRPAPSNNTPAPAPRPAPRPTTATVQAGTTFALRLNEELSTETNQPGDGFTATLADPILDANGN